MIVVWIEVFIVFYFRHRSVHYKLYKLFVGYTENMYIDIWVDIDKSCRVIKQIGTNKDRIDLCMESWYTLVVLSLYSRCTLVVLSLYSRCTLVVPSLYPRYCITVVWVGLHTSCLTLCLQLESLNGRNNNKNNNKTT